MVGSEFEALILMPSGDGYIFRGESKENEQVSSGLFREYHHPWDVEAYQAIEIEDAKRFTSETDDIAILTEIQHYGGKTNLIDFTTNYYIALFFACDGAYSQDGRVIFLNRSGEMSPYICDPHPKYQRVKAQDSIFVRPPKGFIEVDQYGTRVVPKHLKNRLLNYLYSEHGISRRSIYSDVHGLIKYRNDRRRAYISFLKGLQLQRKGQTCAAIKHYSEALNDDHELVDAYNNRALAYKSLRKYELAIEDYNIVERLRPNAKLYHNRGCAYNAMRKYEQAKNAFDKSLALNIARQDKPVTYGNRGWALLHLFEWDKAQADLDCAQHMGWDIGPLFRDHYMNVADFEQKNSIELPKETAAILSRVDTGIESESEP